LMDFARLGAAIGRVLDPEAGEPAFINRYREEREAAALQALDSMPVIVALIEYLEINELYTGNYAGLLKEIERQIGKTVDSAWPKSAKGLSSAIGRAKPILTLLGWEVIPAGRDKCGARVTLRKKTISTKKNNRNFNSTNSTNSTGAEKSAVGVLGAVENGIIYNHAIEKNAPTFKTSCPIAATDIEPDEVEL